MAPPSTPPDFIAHRVKNVVDRGAIHGGHAIRVSELIPQAEVQLFEPPADTFAELQKRIAGRPRLHAHRLALSNASAEAVLHVHQSRFTSSLLATTEPSTVQEVDTQTIRAVALDEWASEQQLPAPDLIKLDLQGHELAALQGASACLSGGTLAVIVEVNFRNR